jgi:hypothetical protein
MGAPPYGSPSRIPDKIENLCIVLTVVNYIHS